LQSSSKPLHKNLKIAEQRVHFLEAFRLTLIGRKHQHERRRI